MQALRCLVAILKSMAAWHSTTTATAAPAATGAAPIANGEAPQPGSATAAEEAVVADESVMESGWMAKLAESGLAPTSSEAALGSLGEVGAAGGERQAVLLESWKGYKRQFQQGVALFNQKPKKGVAYMQEQGLVGPSPADVSQFLARTQGLK